MLGGVGAGGEKPRLPGLCLLTQLLEPQQGGWTKERNPNLREPSGIGSVALKLLAESLTLSIASKHLTLSKYDLETDRAKISKAL